MFNFTNSKPLRVFLFIFFVLVVLALIGEGGYLLGYKQGKLIREKLAPETTGEAEEGSIMGLGTRPEGFGFVTREGFYYGSFDGKIVKIEGRKLTLKPEGEPGEGVPGGIQELVVNVLGKAKLFKYSKESSEAEATVMEEDIGHYLSVGESISVAGLKTDEEGRLFSDRIALFY